MSMHVSNIVAEPNDAAPSASSAIVTKGGRRKGSTKKVAKERQEKKELVTKCATLFQEVYVKAKNKGTIVTSGTLKNIIDEE